MSPALAIIITGFLVAAACGIIGTYLMLRKMAMIGDAIAHAVLPGIVIAFLIAGTRDSFLILAGAALTGILITFLIQWLQQKVKVQADASIGVSFTLLFAIGIILIAAYAGNVDLDYDCVLYGEIAYVPLDVWLTDSGWNMGPRGIYIAGTAFLVNLTLVIVGYKALKITTFDPGLATLLGISTTVWHYLIMGAVSLTTVASFELVGAILVVAFLTVIPATAYLLSNSLKHILILVVLISALVSPLGYLIAYEFDGSIAGAMVIVAAALFALALARNYFLKRTKNAAVTYES